MVGALLAMVIGIQSEVAPYGALPSARQLGWHKLDSYAFVHFGPNTFTDQEWGNGLENPKVFAPTKLDTDQWCRSFKAAGMTAVIITAKHHDGFCLWPSKFSKHTVAQSSYKGDVLKELSASCKKFGLKFGVYLSPWDRNHPAYGTEQYNDVFVNMLEEVLTQYGPVFEVWFDGANGEGPNGKKQVYDFARFNQTVRKFQPNAVIFSDAGPDIRWVGNEAGFANETNWATIDRDRYVPGTPLYQELTEGKQGGSHWVPAECDVSIRKGWFWRASEDSTVKSGETLLDLYLRSVGRGANFLLNVPPNREGQISEIDVKSLKEFGDLKRELFAAPLAVSVYGSSARVKNGFDQAVDGKPSTFWAAPEGQLTGSITLDFGGFKEVDAVTFSETIALGQRVTSWRLALETQDGWKEIRTGTTIGPRRIIRFGQVTGRRLKLEITGAMAPPTISEFRAYEPRISAGDLRNF